MKRKGSIMRKIAIPGLGALLILGWLNMSPMEAGAIGAQDTPQEEKKLQHEEQLRKEERLKEEQKRRQEELSGVKELTIRNSGLRSRSTIVIRYRDADKTIVEVIENGKRLPESEFPRFQPIMLKVLELPEIDRLIPEIDRAYRLAESPEVSEERVYREMKALQSRLSRLDSEVARRYRETAEMQAMGQTFRNKQYISPLL